MPGNASFRNTHCYSIRLNLNKMGPLQFCFPVCLEIHRNPKQKEFFNSCEGFLRLSLLSTWIARGWSPRHIFDKVPKWHFLSTSNKGIWSKKNSNFMQGLKSAILAIFQIGLGWLCPVSAALKNPSKEFNNHFCFGCRLIPKKTGR